MTQYYSTATGKTIREANPPTLTCANGKWSGTRVFDVQTTSPFVAVMTVQIDEDIPVGRLYDEDCDDDWEAYIDTSNGNPIPPLRAHTFSTEKLGSGWTRVTVSYEDDRNVVSFDELTPGYKAGGLTSGLENIQIEETLGAYTRWKKPTSPATDCIGAVVYLGSGGYASIPDRTIGRPSDDKDGQSISIQSPTAIYWERWVLDAADQCINADAIFGTSGGCTFSETDLGNGFVPGWQTEYTWDGTGSPPATLPSAIRKRLNMQAFGTVETVKYETIASAYVGLVNDNIFRGFAAKTLLMQPPDVQQVGQNTWIVTFSWAYSPNWYHDESLDGLYFEDFQVPTYDGLEDEPTCDLQKPGWYAAWFQKDNIDTGNGEIPVVTGMCTGKVYEEANFNMLLPHRLVYDVDTDQLVDLDA